MKKSTPHELLLRRGRWIESAEFCKIVAENRKVGERQARKLINEAYKSRDPRERVMKHVFSDRRVIYGIAEIGPPTPRSVRVLRRNHISGEGLNIEDKILRALTYYKKNRYLVVDLNELANRIAEDPDLIKELAYKLGPRIGVEIGQESKQWDASVA